MNKDKLYYDADGNECSLLEVVKKHPEWAATIIRHYEKNLKPAVQFISDKDYPAGGYVSSEHDEFEGNIKVAVSKNEVRLWVCNNKGENIFRIKAMGAVVKNDRDIIITHGFK